MDIKQLILELKEFDINSRICGDHKLSATDKPSTPCCSKCQSERVTVICNDCGFTHEKE